jgi:hypothetical protein
VTKQEMAEFLVEKVLGFEYIANYWQHDSPEPVCLLTDAKMYENLQSVEQFIYSPVGSKT